MDESLNFCNCSEYGKRSLLSLKFSDAMARSLRQRKARLLEEIEEIESAEAEIAHCRTALRAIL